MVPTFRTKKRDETIADFAKEILHESSYKKLNNYQLFDVSENAIRTFATPVYKMVIAAASGADPEPMLAKLEKDIGNIVDWAKASVFRFWLRDENSSSEEQFLVGVVIDRRRNMARSTFTKGEWTVYARASQLIDAGSDINLVESALQDNHLNDIATIGANAACGLIHAMMNRPHEYTLARGLRSNRERMLNIPAVVTISLSKPIIHTAPNLTPGGGWHMPEHDVRGHERRLRSGKVVWVSGHKRGDPSVQRKTTYRVIP